MSKTRELLIATSNDGKLGEIQAVLSILPLELRSLRDFPKWPSPIEDAQTFLSNAEKKALHYAGHSGLLTLADDSGLEVDALDGEPGVLSARFAGAGKGDAANNAKLLDQLREISLERRTARFHCAMALARPGGVLAWAEGTIEGVILREPRGTGGFGYDSLFWIPELSRTMAELDPEHKNRISHRGRALQNLLVSLREASRS